MAWLKPEDRRVIADRLARELAGPVRVVLFTTSPGGLEVPGRPCPTCGPTQELLTELASLDPRIRLEVHGILSEPERARVLRVERLPAILLERDGEARLRFYGIPAGFELVTLLDGLTMVSRGDSGLGPAVRAQLNELSVPVHVQVFVTPSCPYCPQAARLAYAAAIESPWVQADVVEVSEFPDLIERYRVRGVPKVVINDVVAFEGAVPADVFVRQLRAAAQTPLPPDLSGGAP